MEEAARKDAYPTKQSLAKAMRDTSGGSIHGRIVDIAWAHRKVFDPLEPGSVKGHFHKIELDTTRELKAKIYPLKPEHKEVARMEIQALLKKRMIEEVDQSPYEAPVVRVRKKAPNGEKTKWRLCVDFRHLIEHTVRDAYPMPSMERLLDVGKARFFTNMDLASAFWQDPLSKEDSMKTAFSFDGKTYIWKVMPFGLKNAPPPPSKGWGRKY